MFVIASFIGAAFGASIVYGIGSSSPGGLTPVKLALAGAAISALLGAISSGIALYFNLAQEVSMWNAGGCWSEMGKHQYASANRSSLSLYRDYDVEVYYDFELR